MTLRLLKPCKACADNHLLGFCNVNREAEQIREAGVAEKAIDKQRK